MLLFTVFAISLTLWISGLSESAMLDVVRSENRRSFATAWSLVEEEWRHVSERLEGPAVLQKFRGSIIKGMPDQLTAGLAAEVERGFTDLLFILDEKDSILAASSEFPSYDTPVWLTDVLSDFRQLDPESQRKPFYTRLPVAMLQYVGMEAPPTVREGELLAVGYVKELRSVFGDPLATMLAFNLLSSEGALLDELSSKLGSRISFVHRGLRIVSGRVTEEDLSLSGEHLHLEAQGGSRPKGDVFQSEIEINGVLHTSSYGTVQGFGGEALGHFVVETPVPSAFIGGKSSRIGRDILLFSIAAVILFAFLTRWLIARALLVIQKLTEHMDRVADGELRLMEPVATGDELQVLVERVNGMVDSLREVVRQSQTALAAVSRVARSVDDSMASITENGKQGESAQDKLEATSDILADMIEETIMEMEALDQTSRKGRDSLQVFSDALGVFRADGESLYDSAETTTTAITQMSSNLSSVADMVGRLNVRVRETAQATELIDRAIDEINALTGEASKKAGELSVSAAEDGRRAIENADAGMAIIQDMVTRVGDAVKRVAARTGDIEQVLGLVYEVSDQIKLLSLNASVLAAQAGDAGRGFMVVANAIRNLSERTNVSVNEIEEHVGKIQEESTDAVKMVEEGLKAVAAGGKDVARLGQVVDNLALTVRETSTLTQDVASRTQDQHEASNEVAESLRELTTVSDAILSSSEEQKRTGDYILERANNVRNRASDIRDRTEEHVSELARVTHDLGETTQTAGRLAANAMSARDGMGSLREVMGLLSGILSASRQQASSLDVSVDTLRKESEKLVRLMVRFKLD